mgnify:CR=1 FL=1
MVDVQVRGGTVYSSASVVRYTEAPGAEQTSASVSHPGETRAGDDPSPANCCVLKMDIKRNPSAPALCLPVPGPLTSDPALFFKPSQPEV